MHTHPSQFTVGMLRRLLGPLRSWHPTRVDGIEKLPDGPAVLVSNHGLIGYETLLFFDALKSARGRIPRGLADRWFFEVPLLRDVLVQCGGVLGTRENARALLEQGEWVQCYPGGAREVLKYAPEQRYQLHWAKSDGFVRVALRAGVPIVPVVAAGVDHTYDPVGRLHGTGAWMKHDKYDLPKLRSASAFGLPRRVPFWFRVCDPIEPPAGHVSPGSVRGAHAQVWRAAQHALDALVSEWRAHTRSLGRDTGDDRGADVRAREHPFVVGLRAQFEQSHEGQEQNGELACAS